MPIYEYRCEDCHQMFEDWLKKVEEADVPHVCPICKGTARRVISNTSFALKGQGWYETEYGSKCGKATATGTPGGAEKTAAASCAGCAPSESSTAAPSCTGSGCGAGR